MHHSAELSARIQSVIANRSIICDLGDLEFSSLPDDIGRLKHVELLALGLNKPIVQNQKVSWEFTRDRRSRRTPLDLTPLIPLTNLRGLDLTGCEIQSGALEAIGLLNQLSYLRLQMPHRADVAFVAGLTQLRSLYISGISKKDLTPLATLKNLRRLHISGDGLQPLAGLEQLTSLRNLSIDGGHIADYLPLEGLKELRTLDLRSDAQKTLRGLSGLQKLESLRIGDGEIANLSELSGLRHLKEVAFHYCSRLQDLRPLENLTSLRSMTMENCYRIADWSSLLKCRNLEILRLISCGPQNLGVLSKHPVLQIIREAEPPGM